MTEAPEIKWQIAAHETRESMNSGPAKPNTWTARFGSGYLILHANRSGSETMVYISDNASYLGKFALYGGDPDDVLDSVDLSRES